MFNPWIRKAYVYGTEWDRKIHPEVINENKCIRRNILYFVDPGMMKVYHEASRIAAGIEPDKEIDPMIIKSNKKILEDKIFHRNIAALAIGIIGLLIAALCVVFEGDTLILFTIILFTIVIAGFLTWSTKHLKQNACPRCFAISPWIHLNTTKIGQQQTTVTKEVETKHYAPAKDRRNHIFESASGPQYYQGKSVTKVSVPAIRYDYKERYRCKCCGKIRELNTYKVVEQ